jgi:hypothetical protein
MFRNLTIGLIIVAAIGGALVLGGGRVHLKLGEHHAGIGKHGGYHGKRGGMERTINVRGTGAVVVAPDRARISIGVRSFSLEASQALDVNNAKMARIIEGLKSIGIERRNIQTSDFELRRRTDRNQTRPGNEDGFVGYDISNKVDVETEKVDLIGTILENVISWGATDINDLDFSLTDKSEEMVLVRTRAIEDARIRAEQLVAAAGVSLGSIVNIKEGGGYSYREREAVSLSGSDMQDVLIFMTPEIVSATVSVTFRLE